VTAEAASESVELDPAQIASLRKLRQGALLPRLAADYRRQSMELIAVIEDASRRHDFQALRDAAHQLKSASLTMGAKVLAGVCANLEAAATARATDGFDPLLAELHARHATVLPQLDALSETAAR